MPWAMARSFQQPAEYTLPGGVSVVQNMTSPFRTSPCCQHVTERMHVCVLVVFRQSFLIWVIQCNLVCGKALW